MVAVAACSFHDLPKAVNERAWSSFISASNPLKVDAKLFHSKRGDGTFSFVPVFSPVFKPTAVVKPHKALRSC